jgi:2-oxoglutarate dehydrogenase E2 component (dihydrolipoamide succinyltransferase)
MTGKPGAGEGLSPAVQRLVAENNLNPAAIKATGPGGRITKEDVLAHIEARKQAPAARPAPEQVQPAPQEREKPIAAGKPAPTGAVPSKTPTTMEDLEARLKDIFQARSDKTIFVRASGTVPYGRVVQAMDVAKAAGVERIGNISDKMIEEAGGVVGGQP